MSVNCYRHPNRGATQLCCVCSEPICTECSYTLADKTMCKRCKPEVLKRVQASVVGQQAMENMRQQSIEKLKRKSKDNLLSNCALPFFGIVAGIGFLIFGSTIDMDMGPLNILQICGLILIFIAVIFFLFAYYVYKTELRIISKGNLPRKRKCNRAQNQKILQKDDRRRPNQSSLYSGGSGTTMEDAVVITTTSEPSGIHAEYEYLEMQCGKRNVDWKLKTQELLEGLDGKSYELLIVLLKNGTVREFYFDISSFYR